MVEVIYVRDTDDLHVGNQNHSKDIKVEVRKKARDKYSQDGGFLNLKDFWIKEHYLEDYGIPYKTYCVYARDDKSTRIPLCSQVVVGPPHRDPIQEPNLIADYCPVIHRSMMVPWSLQEQHDKQNQDRSTVRCSSINMSLISRCVTGHGVRRNTGICGGSRSSKCSAT